MDQNTKCINFLTSKQLNSHHWTNEETVFKRKEKIRIEIQDLNIPLKSGLLYKLSKSVFGPFLSELNSKQCQDYILNENKLQILYWHLKHYSKHDMNIVQGRNAFLKDYYELLQKAVNDCNVIDLSFLRKYLKSIYLDCCFIKQIDNSLQKFEHIKILTLCGNFIRDIPGIFLPRRLVFLELFDNFISELSNFVKNAPKTIKHLGLGRNRLTDDSQLHLLADSDNFLRIKSIDLSDNDICDLKDALESLEIFDYLTALSLEGNPCAVTPEYKNEVLLCCPQLQYLDATEVLHKDREDLRYINSETKGNEKSLQIMFYCYRVLGLPEPPKDKKNIQTIHIEVNFPLIFENLPDTEEPAETQGQQMPEEVIQEDDSKDSNDKNKKGKDKKEKVKNKKDKAEKKGKKETEPKKGKKKSYFAGENEYNEKYEESNVWLKTERMPWSKIIEFPPIEIKNDDKLSPTIIRDTLRSIMPVAPYSAKPPKQKSKNKAEKKEKKSKKQSEKEADLFVPEVVEEPAVETPKEIVLKKVTLACFYCELKNINWSDQTIDFYWADHPDMGQRALRANGCLKALEYDINAAAPKKSKNVLKGIEDNGPRKEFLPKILTCQVGIGLNR